MGYVLCNLGIVTIINTFVMLASTYIFNKLGLEDIRHNVQIINGTTDSCDISNPELATTNLNKHCHTQ